jgi:hypothetical protein
MPGQTMKVGLNEKSVKLDVKSSGREGRGVGGLLIVSGQDL